MSITYEEALATLEAMFAAPWTRETLDQVLRLEKGHMENTCDRILNHGGQAPQVLIDRLKTPKPDVQIALDEELARQLAVEHRANRGGAAKAAKKGRGTATELPSDFLRLPGYKPRAAHAAAGASRTSGGGAGAEDGMDDETLARMLQDELFSQELARNPDFAHLARGGRAGGSARAAAPGVRGRASNARLPSASRASTTNDEGPKIIDKISEMGVEARRRLQMFAANFEQKLSTLNNNNMEAAAGRSTMKENSGVEAERRGLLDDDDGEEEIEFEMRKNK
jgi:hypothetical protein